MFSKLLGMKPRVRQRSLKEVLAEQAKIEAVKGYPVLRLSAADLAKLPHIEAMPLRYCPIGTTVRCKPIPALPDVVIVGRLVEGQHAICEQICAPLFGLPERFLNQYRVEIV